MRSILMVFLFVPLTVLGQSSRQDSIWVPLTFLLGKWEGTGGGEPGTGKYERTYQFVLNKRYIEVRNRSVYPPTDQKPNGETHEDIGYISYDRSRHTFILRQFHIEGFVNQYSLDSMSADGRTFVFTSEAIENIAKGWRARESYQKASDQQFTETFELAAPGKPFEVYTKVTLQKSE